MLKRFGREAEQAVASIFKTQLSNDSARGIYQGTTANSARTNALSKLEVEVIAHWVRVSLQEIGVLRSLRRSEDNVYAYGHLGAAGISTCIGDRVGHLVVSPVRTGKLSFG